MRCLAAFPLLLPVLLHAQALPPSIAITDFSPVNAPADEVLAVTGFVRQAVVKAGLYTVLDRADLDRLKKGKTLPGAGCITLECAVRFGKAFGTEKIIVGEYTVLGGSRFMTALLVDVASGKLERDAKVKGFELGAADEAAEQLVSILTGRSPPPVASSAAAPPGSSTPFKRLVSDAGYRPTWQSDTHALLSPPVSKSVGSGNISVFPSGANLVVRLTVVNRPEGYAFPDAVTRRLEVINIDLNGRTFEIDARNGDIDLIARRPMAGMTSELLRTLVDEVAATGVRYAPDLNRLSPTAEAAAVPAAVAGHPNYIRFRSILEKSGFRLNKYSKNPEKPLVTVPDHTLIETAWIEVALTDRERGVVGLELGSPVYGKDASGNYPAAIQERVDRANRDVGAKLFELSPSGRVLATKSLSLATMTPESLRGEVVRLSEMQELVCMDLKPYVKPEAPAAAATPAVNEGGSGDIAAPTWRQVIKKRDRLEKGQGLMQGINADVGERWRFSLSAASGSGFDAFVVDTLNKLHYEGILIRGNGTMESFVSRKSFERVSFEWSPPSTGKYYLIVDNTSFPDGGSQYNGWFDVDILVEYLPAR